MDNRERQVRLWFEMWLRGEDLGIKDIFSEDAVYVESWGPKYIGIEKIKLWFDEWNTRGKVLRWEIKQFFHQGDQTVAEWYFKNAMADGTTEEFDGVSLIRWTEAEKIGFLKEFGCNKNHYDPYQNGHRPHFSGESVRWF